MPKADHCRQRKSSNKVKYSPLNFFSDGFMAKLREQFLQDHPEAFRDIVGHRPTGGGFKFGGIRMERLEIVEMRAVPLIEGVKIVAARTTLQGIVSGRLLFGVLRRIQGRRCRQLPARRIAG